MNHKLFKNKNKYLLIAIIFGLHYSCKADLLKGVCKKKNSVNILIKIYNSGINTGILVRSQFQKHCCTINCTCVVQSFVIVSIV